MTRYAMWHVPHPEAFHATFIHNIQRNGEDKIGWSRSLGTTMSTTTTAYHHHYPPNSQIKRWGEQSREEEPQKTQSHSHSCLFRSRPVIFGGITNRIQGLESNQSAIYDNLQCTSYYSQYKSNYTRRHQHGKYCGPASSTSSSATGPTHLIIIFHDFLPTPRRGSHVKSDKTHTIIKIHPLAHILDT